MMTSKEIKVFIKVRPLITREKNENLTSLWQISQNTISSIDKQYHMTFDNIYDENKSTRELFDDLAKPIVVSALKGINGTIFAYGPTSSGKTYTMMGTESHPGIIPLSIREIFEQIETIQDRIFLVRVGYIEIYNEKIYDLLDGGKAESVKIFETATGEVNVKQLELVATSEEEIIEYYERGNKWRRTGETNMNDRSSRSHTIFKITIESREEGKTNEETAVQVSNLNLVDLAGSERADQTKAEGDRLKEGGHINKSLLALGNVIRYLSDGNVPTFINYRDSKLTRILSASLGGNAMTSIICTVTPAALEETFCTLLFAQNAKKIKNKPKVNEVMTDQAIMKRMEREIKQLKDELAKSRNCEQLKQQIMQKEGQFLHSHNVTVKAIEVNRRRTWAAPNVTTDHLPLSVHRKDLPALSSLSFPTLPGEQSRNSAPLPGDHVSDFDEEFFAPASEINLDRTLSPGGRDTASLSNLILTPREMKKERPFQESPNPQKIKTVEGLLERIRFLEDEMQELNDFKKIETHVGEDHKKLAMKLNFANEKNLVMELKIEELNSKINQLESNDELKEARKERDKAIKAKTDAENILSSCQYEHELFRDRAKKLEEELRKSLAEAREEVHYDSSDKVNSLQETLSAAEKVIETLKAQQGSSFSSDRLSFESAGGDMSSKDRIVELESLLKQAIEDRHKVELTLKDKKLELSRILSEYDETSTQLVDTIEETERLSESLKKMEASKLEERTKFDIKFDLIEKILFSIREELDLPTVDRSDQNDEVVQMLLQVHNRVVELKSNEINLHSTVDQLSNEIEALNLKLPTIQESSAEMEYELKTKCDTLQAELEEMKVALDAKQGELNQVEAQNQELKANFEVMKLAFDAKQGELSQVEAQNQELEADDEEMKLALDATQVEDRSKKSPEENENSDANEQLEDLKQQLKAGELERDSLNQQLNELKASIADKEGKIEDLEVAMSQQASEMSSEITDLKEGLQRVMSLGEENARLKGVEKEFKRMVTDLNVELGEMHARSEQVVAARGLSEINEKRIEELEASEVNLKNILCQMETDIALKVEVIERLETEIEMLNEKIDKLNQVEEEAIHLKEINMDLDVQLHELQDQFTLVQQQLNEKTKEIESDSKTSRFESIAHEAMSEQQNEELRRQLEESIKKTRLLEDQLEVIKNMPDDASSQDTEQLQDRSNEMIEKITMLEEQLEMSMALVEQSNLEKTTVEETHELQDLRNQMKESQEKISGLEKLLTDSMSNQQAASDELKAKIEDLLTSNRDLEQQLTQSQSNARNQEIMHQQQMTETEENLTNTLDKLRALEEKLKESSVSKLSHNEEVDKLKFLAQELDGAREVEASLSSQMKSQADKFNEEVQALKQEVSELQSQREELHSKLAKAEELTKRMEDELKEAQSAAMSSDGELGIFKSKFDALQIQMMTMIESISMLEGYVQDKDREIKELQENVNADSKDPKEGENLKQRLYELEKRNDELKVQIAEIQANAVDDEAVLAELSSLRNEKSSQDQIIEILNLKINETEDQRDEAIENYRKAQKAHSKIHAEKTNLESKIAIVEEEMKTFKRQLKERTDELDDVKARFRRRSSDIDSKQQQFEKEKSELLQTIGAAEACKVLVERELSKLRAEHLQLVEQKLPKLQAEVKKLKTDLSDHDYTFTVLDEKYQQALDLNCNLQAEITRLNSQQKSQLDSVMKNSERLQLELNSLNEKVKQIESDGEVANKLINELRNERESLMLQIDELKLASKRTSPEKGSRNDLYASQNQQLILEGFRGTPSRVGERNAERKTRRQSVHDDRRRLSVWERFTDAEVQTEDVSEICACSSLTQRVKDLQIEVRKRDCKVTNLERMAQHNPLKLDIEELKKSLAREQRDHQQTRHNFESMSRNVHKLESKVAVLSLNQKESKETITRACQTIEVAVKKDKIGGENATGKENVSSNINKISAVENENLLLKKKLQELEERRSQSDDSTVEVDALKGDIEKLQKKYDMTRRLCNLRNDDISGLRSEVGQLKEQITHLQTVYRAKEVDCVKLTQKYEKVKTLCETRLAKVKALRVRLGESETADDQD